MTAETNDKRNEAAIEDEVRRTQDEIGETVDKIEEKLNPREVTRSVVGDDGTRLAEEALEVTRTNPIPVALIAIGVIWLVASSKSPTIRRLRESLRGSFGTSGEGDMDLRPRSAEPAPIGPPPASGEAFDRRRSESAAI